VLAQLSAQHRQLLWRAFFTVVIAIVIPIVTGFAHDAKGAPILSSYEQIVLGVLVFLTTTAAMNAYEISKILGIRQSEQELWRLQNETDATLSNVRASLAAINAMLPLEKNFYAQYFHKVLITVADAAHQAAAQGELITDERIFGTTDILLQVMKQSDCPKLKLVHSMDNHPNEFDFTTWARNYYHQLGEMASSGKVSIRRLFIYSNAAELEQPLAQHLFAYHKTINAEYRAIPRTDWTVIVDGHKPNMIHSDFGIWGDHLAFVTHVSSARHIDGVYTTHAKNIARLGEVFEAAWRLGTTPKSTLQKTVTLDELFSLNPKA
jgi:hypothetical protein